MELLFIIIIIIIIIISYCNWVFTRWQQSYTSTDTTIQKHIHKRNSTNHSTRISNSPTQYNVPTLIQYTYTNTIYPHITKYLHKYDIPINYNIPTQIQYTYTITVYPYKYNIPT
jgi:hypothetical protein